MPNTIKHIYYTVPRGVCQAKGHPLVFSSGRFFAFYSHPKDLAEHSVSNEILTLPTKKDAAKATSSSFGLRKQFTFEKRHKQQSLLPQKGKYVNCV